MLFTVSVRDTRGTGPLSLLRSGIGFVTAPVQYAGSIIVSPVEGFARLLSNLTAPRASLSELKAQNEQLLAELAKSKEAAAAAGRLETLLNFKNTYKLHAQAARVIAHSTDTWAQTLTIDKGSLNGLSIGMPVTDHAAVIGQILECKPNSSVVRLIGDEHAGIAAMAQTTRAQGILRGSANGILRFTLVKSDESVKEGDFVLTSGLGGVFPKGLPLGRIMSIEKPQGAAFYTIQVRALADARSAENVLVITSLGSAASQEQAAGAADTSNVAAAGSQSGSSAKPAGSSSAAGARATGAASGQ